MNGSPKEINQFLLSLSGALALAQGRPAPTVREELTREEAVKAALAGNVTDAGVSLDDVVAGYNRMNGFPAVGEPSHLEQLQTVMEGAAKAAGEPVKEPVAPETAQGAPDHAGAEIPPAKEEPKVDEPKTRKRKGAGKLEAGVTQAQADAAKVEAEKAEADTKAALEPKPDAAATEAKAEPAAAPMYGMSVELLPVGWATWSVTKRRMWAQTQPDLTPSERFALLQANPVPVADPTPAAPAEPKPETKTEAPAEQKAETQPAAAGEVAMAGADFALPPTWEAWSLAKRIMWATMRSVPETNSLLKQFGLLEKIGETTAENLFQVRRKLEIAMRMEAQG